jgi:hypothetical protein
MYKIQIRVWKVSTGYYWASVRPSGKNQKPYEYKTHEEARSALDMLYPSFKYGAEKRVIKEDFKNEDRNY